MIEFGTKKNVVAMGFVQKKCALVCRISPRPNNGGSCIFLIMIYFVSAHAFGMETW